MIWVFAVAVFEPTEGGISTKPKEQKTCLVLLTASAPTRGKGPLAVIWVFKKVEFSLR